MELRINGTPGEIAEVLRRLSSPAPKAKKSKAKAKKQAVKPFVNESGPIPFTMDPNIMFDPNRPSIIPTIWYPSDSTAAPTPPCWTFTIEDDNTLYRNTPYEFPSTTGDFPQ